MDRRSFFKTTAAAITVTWGTGIMPGPEPPDHYVQSTEGMIWGNVEVKRFKYWESHLEQDLDFALAELRTKLLAQLKSR